MYNQTIIYVNQSSWEEKNRIIIAVTVEKNMCLSTAHNADTLQENGRMKLRRKEDLDLSSSYRVELVKLLC